MSFTDIVVIFVVGSIAGAIIMPLLALVRIALERTAWGRRVMKRFDGFRTGEWP